MVDDGDDDSQEKRLLCGKGSREWGIWRPSIVSKGTNDSLGSMHSESDFLNEESRLMRLLRMRNDIECSFIPLVEQNH